MRRFILVSLGIIFLSFILVGKVFQIPELINPDFIIVNKNKIFIVEETSVYIYSLEDFKLLKKFGKKGEGPGEFLTAPGVKIKLFVQNDSLFINSLSKVSIFTEDGRLLKEIRKPRRESEYQPLGEIFAGASVLMENGVQYLTIDLYDKNLNKKKEIFRQRAPFQPQDLNKGFNPLNQESIKFYSKYNRIFVSDENGIIHVFEPTGREIFSIKHDYSRLRVSDMHKEEVYDFYKEHPGTKGMFEYLKSKMRFPEYFPIIRDYQIADNKIYVLPYAEKKGEKFFYVFDMQGNFLETIPTEIKEKNILELFPYSIKDNKLYQLIERGEKWELHVNSLKGK